MSASGAPPPIVSPAMRTARVGVICPRGGPGHGPPRPPTLGRAPAQPWRASESSPAVSSLMIQRGLDERGEQRMRLPGTRAELGVELARDEPRVVAQLDDLHEPLVGPDPRDA